MADESPYPSLRLTACRIYAYQLPLIRPMLMLGRWSSTRSGYLLELRDQSGLSGWGEVAPFAGLHAESLQQAEAELRALAAGFQAKVTSPQAVLEGPRQLQGSASVRFGLAQAQLDLLAQLSGRPPAELLNRQASDAPIRLNALLSGGPEQILTEARQLSQQGFTAYKLKVGRGEPAADIAVVQALSQVLAPGTGLRLDANRAWTAEQALEFGRGIAGTPIEYIEEPFAQAGDLNAHFSALERFHRATGLSYALDESWLEHSRSDAFYQQLTRLPSGLRALIWRPNLLMDWRRPRLPQSLRLILANAFESGLSLALYAGLARGLPAEAMGLDTYRWLAADLLEERIPIRQGQLDPAQAWRLAKQIDRDKLTALM